MARSDIEGWYLGYTLQSVVVLGTVPILLPLLVQDTTGATQAGLVVAALFVGKMSAPLWGSLADRTGRHALIFLGGFLIAAGAIALLAKTRGLAFWLPLALLLGAGAAASATIAGMLIVEFHPKAEWDTRIGWLQTFYGGGWMVGLGLASWLHADPETGLLISAGLLLPAMVAGWAGLSARKAGGAARVSLQPDQCPRRAPRAVEVRSESRRPEIPISRKRGAAPRASERTTRRRESDRPRSRRCRRRASRPPRGGPGRSWRGPGCRRC